MYAKFVMLFTGLVLTIDGMLVVYDDNRTKGPMLHFFTPDGNHQKSVKFRPIYYGAPNSKVRFMATYSDKLYVVDLGKKQ